jgi:hypothetical protein
MAKAQFHKNQRVYVKPVGTWALVERVMPQWAKGLDEPIRIYYDVGLGREFTAEELQAEQPLTITGETGSKENWRIVRARNKWQTPEDCAHHPYPGTYPIVVTGETDWGGWRVPGAEYDLHPQKIEAQARVMSASPKMLSFITSFLDMASRTPENLSNEFLALVQDGKNVLRFMAQEPTESAEPQQGQTARRSTIAAGPHRPQ